MAYTVLARKYRSRNFEEVIGQEPIATTLLNAIKAGRIHHGYLFTGTRGVGKTSMARILAKALNCLKADAPTASPCCACDACISIGEGQDIDVIEIDAASNTGVDNIRELRSNAAYRPARSRFKIYIIDEVHMLSTGAFNALLKTLEEPPEHVKFILATTEIQKVPATIQSRCQRFNFRHIGPDEIVKRLKSIAAEEGAAADEAAVRRIARLANGSMRDALSILDQALSIGPKRLSAEILDELLPPAHDELIVALFTKLAESDASAALELVDRILNTGRGLDVFCNDAIDVARTLMLTCACGADGGVADIPAASRDEYLRLSEQFELSQFVQMIAMFEELRRNVRFSGAGRALTDALIVRLAKLREWAPIESLLSALDDDAPVEEKKKSASPLKSASRAASGVVRPSEPPHPAAPIRNVSQVTPDRRESRVSAPIMESSRGEPRSLSRRDSGVYAVQETSPPPIADTTYDEAVENGASNDMASAVETTPIVTRSEFAPSGGIDEDGEVDSTAPRATSDAPRPTLTPVSAEEKRRIEENDPLVRQTLDLFDGMIVNLQKEAWPSSDERE